MITIRVNKQLYYNLGWGLFVFSGLGFFALANALIGFVDGSLVGLGFYFALVILIPFCLGHIVFVFFRFFPGDSSRKITFDGQELVVKFWRTQKIQIDEITQIDWPNTKSALVIKTTNQTHLIFLNWWDKGDGQLVRLLLKLHEMIPTERQNYWKDFCCVVDQFPGDWPRKPGKPEPDLSHKEKLQTRRFYDWAILLSFGLSLILCFAICFYLREYFPNGEGLSWRLYFWIMGTAFIAPLAIVPFRFAIPKDGYIIRPEHPAIRKFKWQCFNLMVCTLTGTLVAAFFLYKFAQVFENETVCLILVLGGILLFTCAMIFFGLTLGNKEEKIKNDLINQLPDDYIPTAFQRPRESNGNDEMI
jgi:hypothetical protein